MLDELARLETSLAGAALVPLAGGRQAWVAQMRQRHAATVGRQIPRAYAAPAAMRERNGRTTSDLGATRGKLKLVDELANDLRRVAGLIADVCAVAYFLRFTFGAR